jgi:hypothetical protein
MIFITCAEAEVLPVTFTGIMIRGAVQSTGQLEVVTAIARAMPEKALVQAAWFLFVAQKLKAVLVVDNLLTGSYYVV